MKLIEGFPELSTCDAAVDLWILSFADTASRMVLSHQVDVGVSAQFADDPLHDLRCPCHTARHDEVTQKNAAKGYAVFICDQWPYLPAASTSR